MEQTLSAGTTAGIMRGMRGVVLGVANNRSIARGIAKAAHAAGAEFAFTFRATRWKACPTTRPGIRRPCLGHCDVTVPLSIGFAEAEIVGRSTSSSIASPFPTSIS
jgi:enoyl-[acyl-carrier protein] reductase I